jgi:hypothetical protein
MAYYWNYVENLRLKHEEMAPQIGKVVHSLSHLYQTGKIDRTMTMGEVEELAMTLFEGTEAAEPIVKEASRLFISFLRTCDDGKLTFVCSELPLSIELDGCDGLVMYGIPDGFVRTEDGRLWRYETKTAARIDNPYLNGLKKGLQGSMYDYMAEQLMQEKVSGTIHNLIVKTKEPKYYRNFSQRDQRAIDRMLLTIKGVFEDIKQCEESGVWYPSCDCYHFNRECEYTLLCNHDSERVRCGFYTQYKNDVVEPEEGNEE